MPKSSSHTVPSASMSTFEGLTSLWMTPCRWTPPRMMRPETLHAVLAAQLANRGPLTILTATADDARGFGRVLRDPTRRVRAVVEEAHATRRQLALRELNAGVYCARPDWLWRELARLPASPKGEYYLTDLVGVAVAQRRNVASVQLGDRKSVV